MFLITLKQISCDEAQTKADFVTFYLTISAGSTRDVAVNVDKYCQSVFGGGSYLCRVRSRFRQTRYFSDILLFQ